MNPAQRCPILVIALILLHLTGFSQEKKYVKKNLTWQAEKAVSGISVPPKNQRPNPKPSPSFPQQNMPSGFFCKQEYKLEKWAGLPIKFRLGTYEVAHRLEYGK